MVTSISSYCMEYKLLLLSFFSLRATVIPLFAKIIQLGARRRRKLFPLSSVRRRKHDKKFLRAGRFCLYGSQGDEFSKRGREEGPEKEGSPSSWRFPSSASAFVIHSSELYISCCYCRWQRRRRRRTTEKRQKESRRRRRRLQRGIV